MSLRSSTWPAVPHTCEDAGGDQKISTTALDFFLVLTSLEREKVWRTGIMASLGSGRRAGQGAFAFAEICETKTNQLVAVKRSLKLHGPLWEYQEQEFARHFEEFCLELRILNHPSLRGHEHIIDLVGIFEEDVSGVPSLSLILEYGDCGTLDSFLQNNPIQEERLVFDFICQLASGFQSLHNLQICHGDVKAKNVLVASDGSRWICKICDFGHAVVSKKIGDGKVQLPRGTAIYNAPEVRDVDETPRLFTIADALATDLYSFGLLIWELLIQGEVYYKTVKAHGLAAPSSENVHDILKSLPQSTLLRNAYSAIDTRDLSKRFKDRIKSVVRGTLQYHPKDRSSMEAIKKFLSQNGAESQHLSAVTTPRSQVNTVGDTLISWTGKLSLFEILPIVDCHSTLHKISSASIRELIQKQIILELKQLAEYSGLPRRVRASAALSVSQCLQISFGSVYNKDDILSWLESAFVLGNPFALLWFPRICGTLCPDAKILSQFKLVDRGLGEPNESYLASTIRRREFGGWSVSPRDAAEDQESIWISRDIIYQSRSSGESNDILRDSLEGFLDFYKNPDSSRRLKVVSLHGFTPVHCACLGGHLSALELLLDMGYSAVQPTTHGITPLHLCIFFAEYDLEAAVKLLLQYGPCPTETTTLIHWPDYDLVLGGSPLVWAIVTRNLNLVRILLPYYFDDRRAAIRRALENYYWEILEEILQTFPPEENLWDIYGFDFDRTPYGHWIAHGSDRFISIDRTLEVVQRHNQTPVEESSLLISNLIIMMERATTEEHFHHIERLLEIMGPSQIKQTVLSSNSALLQVAMMRAKKNTLWLQTFKALLVHYTVEELQTTSVRAVEGIRGFFLHLAVVRDCVVGARALLEKGVDPNLPARSSGITPLHICFIAKGSVEMCDTLLEFGADVNMELLRSESSPLTTLVAGRRHENSRLVDRILEFDHSEGVIIKMLLNLISGWPAPGDQTFAFLRYLLERPKIAKHLDAKFPDGFTLLHFSVSFCLVEVTQLLLEAGADPLTGFRFEEVDVYPLQVACVRGFHCGQPSKRDRLPSNTKDSVDRGITPLHIAAYMDIEREINRYLGEGKNPEANGKWPGMPGGITPRCIMKSHMAYTKMQQLENEPNRLRKVWGKQLMIFDRNVTSKSSTDFLELISRDTKAAKGLMQAVTKWTARWQKKEALPV